MDLPKDLKYSKTHEWTRLEGDVITVGISDFAQDSLGDIVFVELPSVGDGFSQGDAVAVVESVKTASDIYAPAAGEVVEVNEELEDSPESINEAPYTEGWLFKLRIENTGELDELLDAASYEAIMEEEA